MLGILIKRLELSDKCMAMFHNLSNKKIICYCYEQNTLIKPPTFPIFEMIHAYAHNGPLISTCLETTKALLTLDSVKQRIFYIWNYEWLYGKFDAKYLYNIYMNPKIELLVRTADSYKIVKNTWKRPIGIMEEFNYNDHVKTIFSNERRRKKEIHKSEV